MLTTTQRDVLRAFADESLADRHLSAIPAMQFANALLRTLLSVDERLAEQNERLQSIDGELANAAAKLGKAKP